MLVAAAQQRGGHTLLLLQGLGKVCACTIKVMTQIWQGSCQMCTKGIWALMRPARRLYKNDDALKKQQSTVRLSSCARELPTATVLATHRALRTH